MKVKGDGIFSINTSSSGGFGNAGISLPETVADAGGGGDSPPITDNLSVYFNPDVEVYSDDIETLAIDGDNVRQFNDQSGNGNTLDGSSGSLQPIYDTTTFSGGLASIKSINDSLVLTNPLDFTTTTSFTFYQVYKKASNSSIVYWFKGASNYPRSEHWTTLFQIRGNSGAGRYVYHTDDTNIKILTVTVDRSNGDFKLYINGSYIGAGINPAYYQANPPAYTIAKLFANGNAIMNTGNVLFYTDVHDATQVGEVSDWLNTKYSIY